MQIYLPYLYEIFTARKLCFGQGNVFTRVCHSVHREGGLRMMSLPVWLPGLMFFLGGSLSGGGLCLGEGVSV